MELKQKLLNYIETLSDGEIRALLTEQEIYYEYEAKRIREKVIPRKGDPLTTEEKIVEESNAKEYLRKANKISEWFKEVA